MWWGTAGFGAFKNALRAQEAGGGGRLLRSGRPRSPEDGGELSEDLPGGCEDHRPGRRAADREDSLDRRDRAFWGGEGGAAPRWLSP